MAATGLRKLSLIVPVRKVPSSLERSGGAPLGTTEVTFVRNIEWRPAQRHLRSGNRRADRIWGHHQNGTPQWNTRPDRHSLCVRASMMNGRIKASKRHLSSLVQSTMPRPPYYQKKDCKRCHHGMAIHRQLPHAASGSKLRAPCLRPGCKCPNYIPSKAK
jgi:hypothetical protein